MGAKEEADTERKQSQRFGLLVPKPLARLNLGNPDETRLSGKFGYTGISLQTADNLFIDVVKDTLFQGLKGYNGQVSGTWAQFATGDMWVSCSGGQNVSAKGKVVVASGAGMPAWIALDHGKAPSLVAYNNLELHYRVDEIQNELFEFFHGRRQRQEEPKKLVLSAWQYYKRSGTPIATGTPDGNDAGFKLMATKALDELFPHTVDPKKPPPSALLSDFTHFKVGILGTDWGADDFKNVAEKERPKWGFSKPFAGLDPYGMKNPKEDDNPLVQGFIYLKNALTSIKRFVDVVAKWGDMVADNWIMRTASRCATGVENIMSFTETLLSYPQSIAQPIVYSFPDENISGLALHAKTLGDPAARDFDQAHDDELKKAQAADTRKAMVTTQPGAWDLSEVAEYPDVTVACDANPSGITRKIIWPPMVTLRPAGKRKTAFGWSTLTLAEGQTIRLHFHIDGTDFQLAWGRETFDWGAFTTKLGGLSSRASIKADQAARGGVQETPAGTVTIKSKKKRGEPAVMRVRIECINIDEASARAYVGLAADYQASVTPNVADRTKVKASELLDIFAPIPSGGTDRTQPSGMELTEAQGGLCVTSTKEGVGSKASITAPKAINTKAWKQKYEGNERSSGVYESSASETVSEEIGPLASVTEAPLEWSDEARATRARIGAFKSWWGNLNKLPQDLKNFTRPLMAEVNAITKPLADLEKAANIINPRDWEKFLDAPPAPIGIVGKDGVSIGTPARLVGVGGKGVVFIADGGSGSPDVDKFVPTEQTVKRMLEWRPEFLKAAEPAPKTKPPARPPSIGFRVLSDSIADLTSTIASQLMALGRTSMADGSVDGIGIARVAASYATEIAGQKKVVISARHNESTDDFKKLGRVELAGQTIAIGGVDLKDKANVLVNDFAHDDKSFGITAPKVKTKQYFGGMKQDKGKYVEEDPSIFFEPHVWPEKLRREHPSTQQVLVHSTKEAVIVVGAYYIRVSAVDGGVVIGTREKNADPSINELDVKKPHAILTGAHVEICAKDKGPTLRLTQSSVFAQDADKGASVTLKDGKILAEGKGGKAKIEISDQNIKVTKDDASLELQPAGIVARGGTIKWG